MYGQRRQSLGFFRTPEPPRPRRILARAWRNCAPWQWRSALTEIVIHRTGTPTLSLEPFNNPELRRHGLDLLVCVRSNLLDHFLIDRFGRLYRMADEATLADPVEEGDQAETDVIYVNLNQGFFSVSYGPGSLPDSSVGAAATGYSGDTLAGCSSAQLPSLVVLAFRADRALVTAAASRMWETLIEAEEQIRLCETSSGMSVSRYRLLVQEKYRSIIAAKKPRLVVDKIGGQLYRTAAASVAERPMVSGGRKADHDCTILEQESQKALCS